MKKYDEYQDTRVWRAVAAALDELQSTGDVALNTAPGYVIGYLCHQLAVRRLLGPEAMEYDPQ